MNLENINLSERSLYKRTYMLPFIENVQTRQHYRDRKYISGCLGQGEEVWGNLVIAKGFLWRMVEIF
jgi:hypothetical protein